MGRLRYLSVCSGIEAASVAWHPLGWQPVAFAEIEKFPAAVLAHHYPHVPNLGDITNLKEWPDADLDVLVGGTPCQSFSVAGLRKGLADPRGNLALVFLAIAQRYQPRWVVWENVPGVLSSNGGRDFGSFLGGLGELGYGWAYRVLDAQYVRVDGHGRAVPQRRRRVFVVGYLGDWRRAAAVLFERESVCGHSPPRREAGEGIAPTIAAHTQGGGGLGTDFDCDGGLLAFGGNDTRGPIDVATARNAHAVPHGRLDFESETFIAQTSPALDASFGRLQGASGQDANHGHSHLIAFDTTQITSPTCRSQPEPGKPCHTLSSDAHPPAIAHPYTLAVRGRDGEPDLEYRRDGTANAILTPNGGRAGIGVGAIAQQWAVRRLTPRECERLQGFPDDYTLIPVRGKPAADGPRYKALGNSMAVNCMRWLGRRIEMVEALNLARAA